MAYLSKYGVARHIYIPMVKRAVVDHAVGADWTPAAGDVKISKDGGAAANVTNLPTAIAMGNSALWDFHLSATEMTAALVNVTIADSATKAVEDSGFDIETYGNASAQHEFDLDTASVAQTGDSFARLGAPAGASVSEDVATKMATYTQPTGFLAATFPTTVASPTNITAGTITTVTNVTTVNDKTGYALTSAYDYCKGTVAMTESYAANGAAMTPIQAHYATHQMLMQFVISGTTYTVKKLDNTTTAFLVTLDSATAPTSAART